MSIIASNSYIRVKDSKGFEHVIYPVTKVENVEGLELFIKETAVSKEYVDNAIKNLVGTAPETLDTLKELAAAIGNDKDFANTVLKGLSAKADKNHTHMLTEVAGIATMTESEMNIMISEIFDKTEENIPS